MGLFLLWVSVSPLVQWTGWWRRGCLPTSSCGCLIPAGPLPRVCSNAERSGQQSPGVTKGSRGAGAARLQVKNRGSWAGGGSHTMRWAHRALGAGASVALPAAPHPRSPCWILRSLCLQGPWIAPPPALERGSGSSCPGSGAMSRFLKICWERGRTKGK